jgi:hypothetical protein
VREVAQKLLDGLVAAHELVKDYLDKTAASVKKITEKANAALAAVALGRSQATQDLPSLKQTIAAVTPFKSDLDSMLSTFEGAKRGVVSNLQSKANSRLKELEDAGLTAMLLYNAPTLRQANQAVRDALSAGEWYTIGDKIEVLKGEVNALKPTHRLILSLEQRVQHLTGQVVGNADFTTVTTDLPKKHTIEADKLPEFARRLDNLLWGVQRPIAQTAFDAVSGNDAQANMTLENLLATGMIARGQFNKKYRTSWDTQGGFSVEYTIKGINNIVIHAHCSAGGTPKPGNGSHWKYKTQKFSPGASHEISDPLREQLIDVTEARSKPITKE